MAEHNLSPRKKDNTTQTTDTSHDNQTSKTPLPETDFDMIQRAIRDPSNLTPKLIQRISRMYGNQFAYRLVQTARENTSSRVSSMDSAQNSQQVIQRLTQDQPVNRGQLKYESNVSDSTIGVKITFTPTQTTPQSNEIYIEQYLVNLSPIGDPTTYFKESLSSPDRIKQQTLPVQQVEAGYIVDHIEGELNLSSNEGQQQAQQFKSAYQNGTLHYYINAGVSANGQKGSYDGVTPVPATLEDSPGAPGVPMKYTFIALVHDKQNNQYLGQVKWGYEIVDKKTSPNLFADKIDKETATISEADPTSTATAAQAITNFYNYYALYLDDNVVLNASTWDPILQDLDTLYDLVFNPKLAVYDSDSKQKAMLQPQYLNYPNIKAYRTKIISLLQTFYSQVKMLFSQPQTNVNLTPLMQLQVEAQTMKQRVETVKQHYDDVLNSLGKFTDTKPVIEKIGNLIRCEDYATVKNAEDELLKINIP